MDELVAASILTKWSLSLKTSEFSISTREKTTTNQLQKNTSGINMSVVFFCMLVVVENQCISMTVVNIIFSNGNRLHWNGTSVKTTENVKRK